MKRTELLRFLALRIGAHLAHVIGAEGGGSQTGGPIDLHRDRAHFWRAPVAGRFPPLALWLEMAAVALVAWVVGCWIFDRLRETLVEAL